METIDFDTELEAHKARNRVVLSVVAKHPEIHKELQDGLSNLENEIELTKAARNRFAQYNALIAADAELVDVISSSAPEPTE